MMVGSAKKIQKRLLEKLNSYVWLIKWWISHGIKLYCSSAKKNQWFILKIRTCGSVEMFKNIGKRFLVLSKSTKSAANGKWNFSHLNIFFKLKSNNCYQTIIIMGVGYHTKIKIYFYIENHEFLRAGGMSENLYFYNRHHCSL